MIRILALILITAVAVQCQAQQSDKVYTSDHLIIEKVTDHTYKHITFLETETFGRVACNGMIYSNGHEAVVVDTPTDDEVSKEMIQWISEELESDIVAVVVTHFHVDCLGGLGAFHNEGIRSYAHSATIDLASEKGYEPPKVGFDKSLNLTIGSSQVINTFLGEGHTADNIVTYVPSDQVLFGGCLIKTLGAGKGNLEDANINTWSHTVENVRKRFAQLEIVIPGHGTEGGTELLDYTIELFQLD